MQTNLNQTIDLMRYMYRELSQALSLRTRDDSYTIYCNIITITKPKKQHSCTCNCGGNIQPVDIFDDLELSFDTKGQ
jgi:hypothetical protein